MSLTDASSAGTQHCQSCGFDNPPSMRFCGNCGAPLAASTAVEERKLVTVLFADAVNSTELAGSVDPERLRDQMARLFALTRQEIERFGGTVEKFIGDAVMAVCGLPVIHEDDAERAVRAAVAIRQRVRGDAASLPELRIGINTGEVVANPRAADKGEFLVTGEAVNVAARLQQHAAPGQILIGERTMRAVRDVAVLEPHRMLAVKGKVEPIAAWTVHEVAPPRARALRLTPFVGRDDELALLGGHVRRMLRDGRGHVVTILGQGGVGKTRLAHELRAHTQVEAAAVIRVLQGRALPYGTGVPFWALAEAIRDESGIAFTDPLDVARRKVQEMAQRLEVADAAPALLVVLGLGGAQGALPREALFGGMRHLFLALAERQPLLLLLEDMHSAEDVTLDFLEYAADWIRHGPIGLFILSRPELLERRSTWMGGKRAASTLFLEPLGSGDSRHLIAEILNGLPAPEPLVDLVLERAGGSPLFMEEILRSLIDRGVLTRRGDRWDLSVAVDEVAIPDTIHAVIAARLDALPPAEKQVLQAAAIEGKEFYLGSVRANVEGVDVGDAIAALIGKDMIVRRPRSAIAGEDELTFRHILIRDVAYATMAKSQRLPRHARHADWLRRIAGDRLPEFADVIAHHWMQVVALCRELGQPDDVRARAEAIENLLVAGDRAHAAYANATALHHYGRALDLDPSQDVRLRALVGRGEVWMLMGQHERAREDFDAVLALAQARGEPRWEAMALDQLGLTLRRQDQIAGALEYLDRARAIARRLDDPVLIGRILNHIGFACFSDGRHREAIEAHEEAQRLLEAARSGGDADVATAELAGSLHGIGENMHFLNDLRGSQKWLRESIAVAERVGNRSLVMENGYMVAHGHLLLGEYAAALEASRRVVAVLEEIGDVWNLSVALMVSSRTAAALGDFGKALEGAARGAALAQQLHVIRFRVYNLLTLGIVHREMEDVHAAWQIDREAADLAAQVGGAWLPLALTWRACDEAARGRLDDALTLQAQARRVVEAGQMQVETEEVTATDCRLALQRGDAAGALESVSHLLAHIDEHGTRHWRPPALLLRAECLAGLGRREAATRAFQDAVEDAERIGAAPVLWRALAGLAEQQRAADDLQASVESARQGHAVVERLAASVPDEGLRATFLQSQRVQRLVTLAG